MRREEVVSQNRARIVSVSVLSILAMLAVSVPVFAKKKKGLTGRIIISEKRFPSRFKSDAQMNKYMKKVHKDRLVADKNGKWSFEYMVFSKSPVGTLQAATNIYLADSKCNRGKLVNSITVVPFDKKDSIISGHATLSEDDNFEANQRYLIEFSRSYRGTPLAKTCVALLANPDAPKKEVSNEVNF